MVYSILVSPRTQLEIENAIEYYASNSADAPERFIASVKDAYNQLSKNPFQRIQYKNVRAIHLKKFPYALFFTIDNSIMTVTILSCFHHKRDPDKRP